MLTRFLQAGKWWIQTDCEWRQLYSHRENVAVKSQEQLCFSCIRFILTFSCRDGLNSEFCTSLENGVAESSLLVTSSAQHRLSEEFLFLYLVPEERIHKLASSILLGKIPMSQSVSNSCNSSTHHSWRVHGNHFTFPTYLGMIGTPFT
jgi:hypothetical protein